MRVLVFCVAFDSHPPSHICETPKLCIDILEQCVGLHTCLYYQVSSSWSASVATVGLTIGWHPRPSSSSTSSHPVLSFFLIGTQEL